MKGCKPWNIYESFKFYCDLFEDILDMAKKADKEVIPQNKTKDDHILDPNVTIALNF